jgi:predicted nuclease of predicted toxin-antitoxin system
MRFLADMGISPSAVSALCSSGHDATHLADLALHTLPDGAILEKARAESRVVLTSDLDFGELLAAGGANLPSVVIFRLHDMRPANIGRHLDEVISRFGYALASGAVVSVTEGRIRVRLLPITHE